ncbi:tripartite tricarboxylate transporter substrate binding protein [Rhodoferax sp. TS-BS-61-7]|uniref:Bug family tripartite tricarboxylate transporter substrate binding protein n=1 Tax=Rhodoferax sp. TS-BS-61-7 TaxID=2094194 RepID=UPI000CF72C51|nr:tripartite tricarboxylate transporter substrate binding protein [Rhodoferax sp. TS-BS-61-7]PQA78442.1 tripartite tricarboxylate transporter receptor protein [Rhodoferax sp. TS-BS-61-7]
MKSLNRRTISLGLALLASTVGALPAWADTFPSKPIRIVVPFGAGGVADLTARTVAQKLSESLGQPVVIDNKPGAGGVGAGEAVAKADPDGHTLLLMSNGTAVSASLFKSLPFDAQRDFAPVSTMGYFDLAVLASPNAPYKTMADLLAYAKANPGKLNVGTVNIGSTQNLAAELLKTRAGVDFLIVPFNGTPAVTTALRGGQIDVAVEILGPMMGQVSSKAVRPLAVLSDTRASQIPDVPTLMQSGVKDFDVSSWNALAAPAKTPKEVIARLNKEVLAAMNHPDVKKKLYELNVEARGSTPEKLAELLATETKRWAEVIAKAGVPKL